MTDIKERLRHCYYDADVDKHLASTAFAAADHIDALEAQVAEYKELLSQLDFQAIGRALDLPLGVLVGVHILPGIEARNAQVASHAREIKKLSLHRSMLDGAISEICDALGCPRDKDAALAKIAAMDKALEPLSAVAEKYDGHMFLDEHSPWPDDQVIGMVTTVGVFRRARAARAISPPQTDRRSCRPSGSDDQ